MLKWIKDEIDLILHYNMSVVGGFLGAYALLQRGGNFGSSQTANMIYLTVGGVRGNAGDLLIHVFALLVYICTLVIAFLLPKYIKADMRYVTILAELAGILITGFLPAKMNSIVALYPIFAMTGLQWGTFSGAKGYNSASIFSTNNLRQTVCGLAEYCRTKDAAELRKFKFYMFTLVSFHLGAGLGCVAVIKWAVPGIWLCALPLITAFTFLTVATVKQQKEEMVCGKA
ncbi:YoaK family protein [Konateibacter massiliensis]|uniref:YoaK family protein n=1 Tax=Konateibacter massiliensis TaxID=2002841 RepID=UPI001F1962C9|nr:YoaK family protein [Konateibacter massiliensis]